MDSADARRKRIIAAPLPSAVQAAVGRRLEAHRPGEQAAEIAPIGHANRYADFGNRCVGGAQQLPGLFHAVRGDIVGEAFRRFFFEERGKI